MRSRRSRAGLLAAGAALATAAVVGLSPSSTTLALDQPVDEQLDLGVACLRLGARVAIPEQAGDPLALALHEASLGPAPCST